MINSQEIFLLIRNSINEAKELIQQANRIDLESNGDYVEVETLLRIVDEITLQQPLYNSTIIKNKFGKYAMETRYFNIGEVGVMIEGNNVYAFFEALLNLILTNNHGYFNFNNKNYGVINLLLTIVNTILENNNINNSYKIVNGNNFFDEYNNYILIGGESFLKSFNYYNDTKTIKYCYNEFNVFIDDVNLIEAIDNNKVTVYSTIDLDINYEKASNIDEAIKLINKKRYNYTSVILSNNKENTLKFLTNIQGRYVFSNVLLSANNRVGINQSDLLIEKTIAYQENA